MSSFLKKIDIELSKKIISFEKANGELQDFTIHKFLEKGDVDFSDFNSFSSQEHSMTIEKGFCEPDLDNLIKYEEELNGRN